MRVLGSRFTRALVTVLVCSACKGAGDPSEPASNTDAAASERAPLPEPKMIPSRSPPLPARDVRAELPAPPSPDPTGAPDVPLIYEDGAYSIKGLREDLDAQLAAGEGGLDVRVRAWVQHVHVPPPDCPTAPRCPQPHVFVSDGPDIQGRRRALLVGPYALDLDAAEARRWAGEPEVVLELGKQYLFKGKFVRFSDTGLADERGLLQFTAYQDPAGEWVYAKGSPSNPKVAAWETEQNAALLEQIMRNQAREHER